MDNIDRNTNLVIIWCENDPPLAPWRVYEIDTNKYVLGVQYIEHALRLFPNAFIHAPSLQKWRFVLEKKLKHRLMVS